MVGQLTFHTGLSLYMTFCTHTLLSCCCLLLVVVVVVVNRSDFPSRQMTMGRSLFYSFWLLPFNHNQRKRIWDRS